MPAVLAASSTRFVEIKTPFGRFMLIERPGGALASHWWTRTGLPRGAMFDRSLRPDVVDSLRRYFDGEEDVEFSSVDTPAGPPFFRRCWMACRTIPRGSTWTYAQLAAAADNPSGARAAGQAMRSNPLPVIVPCHRVIATGGGLHGFGGTCDGSSRQLDLKAGLLRLEGAMP